MSQIAKLSALGVDVDRLSSEQRDVLVGLSPEEISVLTSVKQRLESVGGDVEGHIASAAEPPTIVGGVIF